ncbi:MAG: hypothetical protein ACM3JP_01055 [Betaproteobacteria bacterium]
MDACLAEYSALRNEIEWLIKDASQYQTYALGLVAVLPAAFALLVDTRQSWLLAPAILATCAAFIMFGYLFFRNHQEVYVVAAYLSTVVRPLVRQLSGSGQLWSWEEYKASTYARLRRASRVGVLASPRFVVMLRLLVFIMPAVAGLTAVSVMLARSGVPAAVRTYSWPGLVALSVFAAVDFVGLLLVIGWFWSKRDLETTLGLDATPPADEHASA